MRLQILPLQLRAEQCPTKEVTLFLLKQIFSNESELLKNYFETMSSALDESRVTRGAADECPIRVRSDPFGMSAAGLLCLR
jgi:hypothetical protein